MNRSINSLLDVVGSVTDYERYSKDFNDELSNRLGHAPTMADAIDYLFDDLISSIDADFGPIEQMAKTAYDLGLAEASISDIAKLSYGKKDELEGPLRSTFIMEYLRGRQDGLSSVVGKPTNPSRSTLLGSLGDMWVIGAAIVVFIGCIMGCIKLSW